MALFQFEDRRPEVHESAYVAESAEVIGAVTLAEGASVWSNVVIRGDNEPIAIGRDSNLQEGSVLHTDMGCPLVVGEGVTVGHQAMLHGCSIGDGSLIGIQAVVLNRARIGRNCLVAAGAVVTEGKEFPDGSLIVGSPAVVKRQLDPEQIARMQLGARSYVERAQRFKRGLKRVG